MADRDFGGVLKTVGGRVRVVAGRARLNGAQTPTIEAGGNLVAFVNHAAQGVYTLFLKDRYLKPIFLSATYCSDIDQGNVDLYAQPLSDLALTGVPEAPMSLNIRLKTGAAQTDPPASPDGGTLDWFFVFEDSGAF